MQGEYRMDSEEFLAQWTAMFGGKWASKTKAVKSGFRSLDFNQPLWANIRAGHMEAQRKQRTFRDGKHTNPEYRITSCDLCGVAWHEHEVNH